MVHATSGKIAFTLLNHLQQKAVYNSRNANIRIKKTKMKKKSYSFRVILANHFLIFSSMAATRISIAQPP